MGGGGVAAFPPLVVGVVEPVTPVVGSVSLGMTRQRTSKKEVGMGIKQTHPCQVLKAWCTCTYTTIDC